MRVRARAGRRFDVIVGALLLLTYAYFYQGGFSNQNARFDLTMSLAFEHTVRIDTFADNTIDKVVVDHHTFLEKAPAASYLALPVPLVASLFWTTDSLFASPWRADILLYLGTVMSVSLLSALAAVAFRRTLHLLNPAIDPRASSLVTISIFGGTLALPYATMLFGHQIAASFIVLGLYALLHAATVDEDARVHGIAGWLCLGATVLTEYPSAVVVGGVALGVLWYADVKPRVRLLRLAPFAALPLLGILAHNTAVFGGPFAFGYGKLQGSQFGAGMSRGLFGVALPRLSIVGQLLFGMYRGLFVYSPVLVVTGAAYVFWPKDRTRRLAIPLLLGALALILTISGYFFWQGGTCFGPRHLVAAIPILGLGAAFAPPAWLRSPIVIGIAALSLGIALLGTVITPNVTEMCLTPLTTAYPSLLASGRVSISPVTFLMSVTDNGLRHTHYLDYPMAAVNLGELVGLRGWTSVLPLAVAWVLAIRAILRTPRLSAPA